MIEWRFKPNSRDDMDVDSILGGFFTTRDIDNISTLNRTAAFKQIGNAVPPLMAFSIAKTIKTLFHI